MEICGGKRNDQHDEIVHNEVTCPLCLALEQIASLERENEKLNNQE